MPDLAELAETSPPGMAHFARTGPPGETCSTCRWFMGHKRAHGKHPSRLEPGRCKKFVKMMRAAGFRRVEVFRLPVDTPACRHYELRGAPRAA